MNRPRFSRLRRRSPQPTPPYPYRSDSEPAWLEFDHEPDAEGEEEVLLGRS